jgi:hypothetical protein
MQDALGEGYDAHADGTGFFALQSCANHSCEPNAHTLKVGTRAALQSGRGSDGCTATAGYHMNALILQESRCLAGWTQIRTRD